MTGAHGIDIILFHQEEVLISHLRRNDAAAVAGKFVAVDAAENDAFSVQAHEAVLHLKAPETHALPDDFQKSLLRLFFIIPHSVFTDQAEGQIIEQGILCAPERRRQKSLRDSHKGSPLVLIICVLSHFHCAVQDLFPSFYKCIVKAQASGLIPGRTGLSRQHDLRFYGKSARRKCVVQSRTDTQVIDMGTGDRIQVNVPENTGEAEKVLALKPAGGSPFKDTHSKFVEARPDESCQVKFRRGKAVLAVADILSVAPQGKTALHSLEGNDQGTSLVQIVLHGCRDREIFYIGRRGIIVLRNLAGNDILPAVPGILIIDIGGNIIPFHLNMGRDTDVRPCAAVIREGFKACGRVRRLFRIGKLPEAVQGIAQYR